MRLANGTYRRAGESFSATASSLPEDLTANRWSDLHVPLAAQLNPMTGWSSVRPPVEPKYWASPKVKMPPSEATSK